MANNGTFKNVYKITQSGAEYTFNNNDPLVTSNIAVTEVKSGSDSTTTLSTTTGDKFTSSGSILTGEYTYLGTAQEVQGTKVTVLNGAFIATDGNGNFFLFTDENLSNGKHTFKADVGGNTVICFLPGTQIATPKGEVCVESLKRGDLVTTADGRTVPVRWVGRQTISTIFADPLRVLPICIKAGALAENVPSRDLYVSPGHAMLIDDILVHASALVNGTSIVRAPAPAQTFTYFHVELADHSLLLADNAPAESFIDNVDRLAFDNWDEHEALGDEAAPLVEMSYPRAKAARQVPVAMRERLAARGQALFGAVTTKAA
jgi:hypothetical protein